MAAGDRQHNSQCLHQTNGLCGGLGSWHQLHSMPSPTYICMCMYILHTISELNILKMGDPSMHGDLLICSILSYTHKYPSVNAMSFSGSVHGNTYSETFLEL